MNINYFLKYHMNVFYYKDVWYNDVIYVVERYHTNESDLH